MLKDRSVTKLVLPALLMVSTIMGCARSFNPDVERGSNFKFRSGYPEVRLSVLSSWNEQFQTHIEVTADIVYGSVFFKKEDKKRRADLAIEMFIREVEKDSMAYATRFSYDKIIHSVETANSQETFTFRERYQVAPGTYEVKLSLIDQHTNKKTTRLTEVRVPNTDREATYFSNVRLYGKELNEIDKGWFPITTYDIPSKIDSLKLTYQVTNNSESNLTLDTRLVRFKADTTPAKPMYDNSYNPSDIAYKGIDLGEKETIQSNIRTLPPSADVTIDLKISMLERGNYRYEVRATDENEAEYYKARDFGIKSLNYPTLKSPRELARPLTYLMGKDEYEEMMDIKDPKLLKQEVDKFWLRHIGNRNDARTIISLYYSRVEEANKLFSNFKEGWKTDRGMVYILFGAPWGTNKIHDKIHWSYTYNLSDRDKNFTFFTNHIKSEYFPFEHYILRRRASYYQPQYKQEQLWRTGLIMIRKL